MTDRFLDALAWLWPIEGGWSPPRPGDPNPTMYGITQNTYDRCRVKYDFPVDSVRNLTRQEAAIIYRGEYWDAAGCPTLPWPLGCVHFDAAVNHGVGNAGRLLLRANGTWAGYIDARRAFYEAILNRDPTMQPNARGWAKRMDRLETFCRSLDNAAPPEEILVPARGDSRPGHRLWRRKRLG